MKREPRHRISIRSIWKKIDVLIAIIVTINFWIIIDLRIDNGFFLQIVINIGDDTIFINSQPWLKLRTLVYDLQRKADPVL